jgi:HEAT repeat protein
MPFVKHGVSGPATEDGPREEPLASPIAALRSLDAKTRWSAARALRGLAKAVPALADALSKEQVPHVQEAIITALMRVGDEASVMALLPYLRSQDPSQRSAVIEALQALPGAVLPFMASLLGDPESDVRILATELTRTLPEGDATRLLCGLLEREQHSNVCAAAVDVLAEVGTPEALPALRACAERFAGTPFLPFAISVAIARISSMES